MKHVPYFLSAERETPQGRFMITSDTGTGALFQDPQTIAHSVQSCFGSFRLFPRRVLSCLVSGFRQELIDS